MLLIAQATPSRAAGKLKALAVSSPKRSAQMPSLPTLDESGLKGYQRLGWNGVLTQAAVSKDIITRLNAVIVKAVNTPEMRDTMVKQGFEPRTTTAEEFAAFIRNELALNTRLAKFAGLKPE